MRRAHDLIDAMINYDEVPYDEFLRVLREHNGTPDPARFTKVTSIKTPAVQAERARQRAEQREASA